MTRSSWLLGGLLAGLFFALHLPFLPPSLEDLDSINFAFGIHVFDVARHQPHPPGYPLFIVIARVVYRLIPNEPQALGAVSVVSGTLGYQVLGEEAKFAGPGELVVWPPGTPHKWWNAGNTDLHMTGWCRPPGNVEFFLGAIFASMKATRKNRPSIFDAAFLITKYRAEFGMLAIPAPVQRIVFPIAIAFGRLLGKYDKYADAPSPMSR